MAEQRKKSSSSTKRTAPAHRNTSQGYSTESDGPDLPAVSGESRSQRKSAGSQTGSRSKGTTNSQSGGRSTGTRNSQGGGRSSGSQSGGQGNRNSGSQSARQGSRSNGNGNRNAGSRPSQAGNQSKQIRPVYRSGSPLNAEIILILFCTLFCLLFLSNFGLIGPAGNGISNVLFGIFGITAYAVPAILFVAIMMHAVRKGNPDGLAKVWGVILLIIAICLLVTLFTVDTAKMNPLDCFRTSKESRQGGGFIGGLFGQITVPLIGIVGAYIVDFVLFVISIILFSGHSVMKSIVRRFEYLVGAVEKLADDEEDDEEDALSADGSGRSGQTGRGTRQAPRQIDFLQMDTNTQAGPDNYKDTDSEKERREVPETRSRREPDYPYDGSPLQKRIHEDRFSLKNTENENSDEMGEIHIDTYPEVYDLGLDEESDGQMSFAGKRKEERRQASATDLYEDSIEQEMGEEVTPAKTKRASSRRKPRGLAAIQQFDDDDLDDEDDFLMSPSERQGYGFDYGYGSEDSMESFPEETGVRKTRSSVRTNAEDITESFPEETGSRKTRSSVGNRAEDIDDTDEDEFVFSRPSGSRNATNIEDRDEEDAEVPRRPSRRVSRAVKNSSASGASAVTETGNPAAADRTGTSASVQAAAVSVRTPAPARSAGKASAGDDSPYGNYRFPSPSLLQKGSNGGNQTSKDELAETMENLQDTLTVFGVDAEVVGYSCGPAVTRYEIKPAPGVKVSKIVGLTDDIKLSLAAADIRIEAPIPGKSLIGIEVPNRKGSVVHFRDLIESADFKEKNSKITFAVGKDIAGQVTVTDIAKMPHLLIAGATGSGKSVCINTIIMSILYKAKPDEVKLVMIDPKVVELSVYNGIPHLMIPVVTDPKKAAGALNWAVAEMTDRYNKFATAHVRDLKGYNAKVESIQVPEGQERPKKLPLIVIIVDELADLMMVASKEVEESICRLAQLARACGIHLIIATQRPSVNVITGLIKANMPSRIAFAVTSGVDSRTILDMNGAEKLLGKGDMLFSPQGASKPYRIQGAFISDEEVQSVVEFIKKQNVPAEDNSDIVKQVESMQSTGNDTLASASGAAAAETENGKDPYFEEAGKVITSKEKASIGMLQRYLKIGFNRAARIMDQLEEAGVVGAEEGTKPRAVLMTESEFEEYIAQSE